jgi:putative endonuclease
VARDVRRHPGMSDDARQSLGKSGEDRACEALRRRGYVILERRYRARMGEIDIIARDGGTIVFVEVKARAGDDYGGAAAAVTPWKQRKVALMAAGYLARRGIHDAPCRFDVVVVDYNAGGDADVEVIPHAFDAPF